jgi:hypothetical protein
MAEESSLVNQAVEQFKAELGAQKLVPTWG